MNSTHSKFRNRNPGPAGQVAQERPSLRQTGSAVATGSDHSAVGNRKPAIENRKFPHFLDCQPAVYRDPRAPYAVLPVPYERTVCYGRGTARAPAAILAASLQIELMDEELFLPLDLKVQTMPAIPCRHGTDAHVLETIRRAALPVLRDGRFLMTLGGEHTVTMPAVKAAQAVHRDLTVLHFDAHLDLRAIYKNEYYSHACVMRRVMELGVPIVSVGIRSVCAEEYRLVKQRRLPVFWARDIVDTATDSWMKAVLARLGKCVYISVDVDCLDPALMPGTGTPEPGGIGWYALTRLLRLVCASRRVVAADVVETVPVPGTPACEYIAARLATKLMLYHRVGTARRTAQSKRRTSDIERPTSN